MSKAEVINILSQFNEEAKAKYKSKIIGLFGSYARNEGSQESDIDILIEKDGDLTLFDLSALKIRLEEKLNARVDIVTTTALREEIKSYVMNDLIYV